MAYLINRKAPSRIECLHSLIKFLYKNYKNKSFRLDDCMFSRDEDNIHNYCSLIEKTVLGYKCPYKESPLSDAGCYITNGKLEDTTKKKEVSNTINALHGMGFLIRKDHDIYISELGEQFANLSLFTDKAACLIQKAILSYGPVIGVVDEIEKTVNNDTFNANEIEVGYPVSNESVFENGCYVTISSGSTRDANTRSRSCYLSWLITAGVIEPIGVIPDNNSNIPYYKYRSYINAETLSARKYKLLISPSELYKKFEKTEHPLDYINLTKRTMALRENGQENIREMTLKYESRIQNRRFAIMYLLNRAYEKNTTLNFKQLKEFMLKHPRYFLISEENFDGVLKEELHIANVGGIPYDIKILNNEIELVPKVGLNIRELSIGAPLAIVELLNSF